jgi:predicted nucleotidyltransferase
MNLPLTHFIFESARAIIISGCTLKNRQANSLGAKMSVVVLDKPVLNQILTEYGQVLAETFPEQIKHLILFGSQARGEATAESDIDLLVVVTWQEKLSPKGGYAAPLSDPRWREIMTIAYDLSLKYGVNLAPFVISEDRFQQWSLFTDQIKREGIEVWTKS